tara:strand:+ start:1796 stop:2593 length:798 start_codon:yes stop_codon:yes gene_type:complete
MLTKRIIPCLDVKDGRVVKGIQFRDHRDAGDPVALSRFYDQEGADELVFYDIGASADGRGIMRNVVSRVAEQVFIPLTVGGGLRSVQDMRSMLLAGADKVSINTAAVERPSLIREAAEYFGSQCIVVGIDALRVRDSDVMRWEVRTRTGKGGGVVTGIDAVAWAIRAMELGAGEIVVNSMDADGTQAGYDLELLRALASVLTIPIVASGGAGNPGHMYSALVDGKADAALAASILHYGDHRVTDIKDYLAAHGVSVRPVNNQVDS